MLGSEDRIHVSDYVLTLQQSEIKSACCPLCGTLTEKVITRVLRRGHGTVFHCDDCDFGFIGIPGDDPSKYSNGEYRRHASHHADGRATNPQEIFDTYKNYQSERLALVRPHLNPESSILEIGSSAGQFLCHLNMVKRRCAIEPDDACCNFMNGLGIETDISKFFEEVFDVVCCFQTLEHVVNPVSLLKEIRAYMKPGGVPFVEVPNLHDGLLDIWGIPEYRNFYFHSDHLSYFSAKSLKLAAEKAGFQNPEVTFSQDYNLLNTLHWLMAKSPQPTCHIGLGPVAVEGKDERMAKWLSSAIVAIDGMYTRTLVAEGKTSNLVMKLGIYILNSHNQQLRKN